MVPLLPLELLYTGVNNAQIWLQLIVTVGKVVDWNCGKLKGEVKRAKSLQNSSEAIQNHNNRSSARMEAADQAKRMSAWLMSDSRKKLLDARRCFSENGSLVQKRRIKRNSGKRNGSRHKGGKERRI